MQEGSPRVLIGNGKDPSTSEYIFSGTSSLSGSFKFAHSIALIENPTTGHFDLIVADLAVSPHTLILLLLLRCSLHFLHSLFSDLVHLLFQDKDNTRPHYYRNQGNGSFVDVVSLITSLLH